MADTIATNAILNYSGTLFNKGNTRTPLSSIIGGKAKTTNHVEFATGQEYNTGTTAEQPAISEEASLTAPEASVVTREQKTNVTQIFMEKVGISYAKQSNMGTLAGLNVASQTANPINELDFQNKRILAVTCHRRENYGEPMQNIMHAILRVVESHPDVEVVYPVHLSPVVRECVFPILGGHDRIHLIDPVDVEEMHNLIARCYMVMTDSGGLQEEAPALGKPVLVMRRETERPEAIAAGTAKLAGVDPDEIVRLASELLDDPAAYAGMAKAVNPYGDGHASERIVQAILWHFGRTEEKPADFNA